MPAVGEMDLAQAQARVLDLEEAIERLRETNARLSERMKTDKVVQKIGELSLELGRLQAELGSAQKKVEKLQAACDAHVEEKSALSAALAERIRDIKSAETKLGETMKTLFANQAALAAKSWAPWIAATVVVVVMVFLVTKGIIIPRTGDLAADVCNSVNQLNALEQERRTREIDLQKPHQAWSLSKVMTADENAILTVSIYTNEKKYSNTQTEFVTALVLATCRNRLSVIKLSRDFLAVVTEQGIPQVPMQDSGQISAFLNQELKEGGLGMIRDKIPEFNLNFQVQFLKAPEQERNWGCGLLFFKNGKFSSQPDQPVYQTLPAEPGA